MKFLSWYFGFWKHLDWYDKYQNDVACIFRIIRLYNFDHLNKSLDILEWLPMLGCITMHAKQSNFACSFKILGIRYVWLPMPVSHSWNEGNLCISQSIILHTRSLELKYYFMQTWLVKWWNMKRIMCQASVWCQKHLPAMVESSDELQDENHSSLFFQVCKSILPKFMCKDLIVLMDENKEHSYFLFILNFSIHNLQIIRNNKLSIDANKGSYLTDLEKVYGLCLLLVFLQCLVCKTKNFLYSFLTISVEVFSSLLFFNSLS